MGEIPFRDWVVRGLVCETTRDVETNLQVCRSNKCNRRRDRLVDRSGGFLGTAGQRPTPRTWRRTSRFVGTVVVTRSSSSRSFASQAESLRHERGAFFALTPALSRSDAGFVHRKSFRGRGGYARLTPLFRVDSVRWLTPVGHRPPCLIRPAATPFDRSRSRRGLRWRAAMRPNGACCRTRVEWAVSPSGGRQSGTGQNHWPLVSQGVATAAYGRF